MCFFVVGQEEKVVPAHKVIMGASGSFPISLCNEDSIQILGVDYLILYALLQYIYTSRSQVNGTAMVHCGFYSEKGGLKLSEEDKSYMQTCKVVVSTCIFGGGDDLYQPIGMSQASLEKVCYVAFWDEITLTTQEADGKKINEDCMIGKWRIMLTTRLFPQARISIWVDFNSQFWRDPLGVLEALLWRTNSILAISEHGARSSVNDEVKAVVHKNKAAPEEVDRQMTQYFHYGFPDDKATRDSPPPDGVRGINCIMKDMYGGTVAYGSIQLSGVAPEGFYRVIVDEVIRDDLQLFMEGGTLVDMKSSLVSKTSTSGGSVESEIGMSGSEEEVRVDQFPDFPRRLVSYPPCSDAFKEFCKARASTGGRWGNCIDYAGRQFRGCTVVTGEECFYLLAGLAKEKRDRG
ncbi:hypothetical protein GIB67_031680 [Kingdonia uniflora]|uniref:BTB domain-containing protein n=1 Tax=Kingdonia uniflora TaxID=39325 RepID=A0A7J7NJS2_9MAGN|nr:hypothetical protein GIB67_031680 [Kingdonia uniflora]